MSLRHSHRLDEVLKFIERVLKKVLKRIKFTFLHIPWRVDHFKRTFLWAVSCRQQCNFLSCLPPLTFSFCPSDLIVFCVWDRTHHILLLYSRPPGSRSRAPHTGSLCSLSWSLNGVEPFEAHEVYFLLRVFDTFVLSKCWVCVRTISPRLYQWASTSAL